MTTPTDFEKLGVFYLGREFDLSSGSVRDDLVLYDSKDLVTHAVCVGMTGSGKTGLCIGLLEEAAMDGIPAIIIDPKGDLSNLLLTFPNLSPEDFRPWINEDDARKSGVTPEEFATQQAETWKKGLQKWGQDGDRIARLRRNAEFRIYTPGSNAGRPLSVLRSFEAPSDEVMQDGELYRDRVAGTATSLLGLMGIDADPIQSREHILLSAIIDHAWRQGEKLDIAGLIDRIQKPPFDRLGVMSLENVFPGKDRFALAMALNNLVAAPGFGAWMEGEPLDIARMLYATDGKPRHAVFSIAHLGEAERMFFVSLLLNQVLAWTRSQSGTTSLRAIVYMDEIAGYFPPTANPPSKKPLLTLMKQARAFGVGVVLATQNPVDLDYKGLANAGTWFIGRLQTERDKQRVLDGLEGAAATASSAFDRSAMDRMLSALGQRVFLMNNVHEDQPVVFQTRWCMSYLRGPLTRQQIRSLSGGQSPTPAAPSAEPSAALPTPVSARVSISPAPAPRAAAPRPVLPAEVPQFFFPCRAIPKGAALAYRPMALGFAKVYYSDTKLGVDQEMSQALMAPITSGPVVVDWDEAEAVDLAESDLESHAEPGAGFDPLPASATVAKTYESWKSPCADALFKSGRIELFKSAEYKLTSRTGESEGEFRVRLAQAVREDRDARKEKLRQKYGPKLAALAERRRKAEAAAEVQKQQSTGAKLQAVVGVGAAILGAFMGRKVMSATTVRSAGTALGRVQRTMQESGDVSRAEETVEAINQQASALQREFDAEIAAVDQGFDPLTAPLEKLTLKPKKSNIKVRSVVLAWAPFADDGSGPTPAW